MRLSAANVFGPSMHGSLSWPMGWLYLTQLNAMISLKTNRLEIKCTISTPMSSSSFNSHLAESVSSLTSSPITMEQAVVAAFTTNRSINPVDLIKVIIILNYSYLRLSDTKICGRHLLKSSKRRQTFKQRSKSFKKKSSTFNFVSRHRKEVGANQPQMSRQSRRRLLAGQSFLVSSTFLELPLTISWTKSPISNMMIQAATRTTMHISGPQQNYTA